jgi:glutathione S-transferase
MQRAILTINSRNYGAWSLRSWLLCRWAGLDFDETVRNSDDPSTRAELLQLSPSYLVPRLDHDGVELWDTLAIAEYLNEILPESGMLPGDRFARAHCRSISGELHSGFERLRSAAPMNMRRSHAGFKLWTGAQADVDRLLTIWTECISKYGGPWLFGDSPTVADAMSAPECSRFATYRLWCDPTSGGYVEKVLRSREVQEWLAAAKVEPDDLSDLEMEF